MTDPPSDDGRTARSDAASRLAALLSDVVEPPAPAPPPARSEAETADGAARPPAGGDEGAADGVTAGGVVVDDAPEGTDLPPGDGGATDARPAADGSADDGPAHDGSADARPADAEPAEPPTEPVAAAGGTATERAGTARPDAPGPDAPAGEAADAAVEAPAPAPATPAPGEPTAEEPAAEPAPEEPAADVRPSEEPAGVGAAAAPAAAADEADAPPLGRVTLRAVAFGTALVLLVAAIPALGWVGKERLLRSRGGDVVEGTTDPSEPGYRALVAPTSTGLVVHRDAEGNPTSATVLALGAGDAGGTVLQVPLTTQVHEPFMIRRLIGIWEAERDDERFRRHVEEILGVAVPGPVIDLTDESLASLVEPVAPLEISGTDPVVTDDGVEYSGDISLPADEVGPYLRAAREGEPELARLARSEKVWAAWLAELGEVGVDRGVGAATTGIGPFLRVLAAGDPVVTTLDVEPDEPMYFGDIPPLVPTETFDRQIADAVPFPQTPSPGRRTTIKLLNGAVGETLPMDLMHDLVVAGGALVTLGNADELGQSATLVEYGGSGLRDEAEAFAELLGGDVEVEQMSDQRAEAEVEDVVITIGSDVLERYGDGG